MVVLSWLLLVGSNELQAVAPNNCLSLVSPLSKISGNFNHGRIESLWVVHPDHPVMIRRDYFVIRMDHLNETTSGFADRPIEESDFMMRLPFSKELAVFFSLNWALPSLQASYSTLSPSDMSAHQESLSWRDRRLTRNTQILAEGPFLKDPFPIRRLELGARLPWPSLFYNLTAEPLLGAYNRISGFRILRSTQSDIADSLQLITDRRDLVTLAQRDSAPALISFVSGLMLKFAYIKAAEFGPVEIYPRELSGIRSATVAQKDAESASYTEPDEQSTAGPIGDRGAEITIQRFYKRRILGFENEAVRSISSIILQSKDEMRVEKLSAPFISGSVKMLMTLSIATQGRLSIALELTKERIDISELRLEFSSESAAEHELLSNDSYELAFGSRDGLAPEIMQISLARNDLNTYNLVLKDKNTGRLFRASLRGSVELAALIQLLPTTSQ